MLITVTVGIYSVTWIFQFLYNMAERKEIPVITASMTKLPNGADANHSIIFNFQENGAQGIATTSLIYSDDPDKSRSAGPAIRIQGTHGEVQLWPPAYSQKSAASSIIPITILLKSWRVDLLTIG